MGYRWRRFDRRNIKRRVRLRMESLRIFELDKYAERIIRDGDERAAFDSLLRLTITRFFRNRELWLDLGALILEWDKDLADGKTLKTWSAGCAGGEEAFSAAMLLDDLDRSGHLKHPWTILGTDADPASLSRFKAAASFNLPQCSPPHCKFLNSVFFFFFRSKFVLQIFYYLLARNIEYRLLLVLIEKYHYRF